MSGPGSCATECRQCAQGVGISVGREPFERGHSLLGRKRDITANQEPPRLECGARFLARRFLYRRGHGRLFSLLKSSCVAKPRGSVSTHRRGGGQRFFDRSEDIVVELVICSTSVLQWRR